MTILNTTIIEKERSKWLVRELMKIMKTTVSNTAIIHVEDYVFSMKNMRNTTYRATAMPKPKNKIWDSC
jgi:hypothetical protein